MQQPGDFGVEISSEVRGTTFSAEYRVEGESVLLFSPDFGETSSALNQATAEQTAKRLLKELAEAAMERPGASFMTDEEARH